MVCGVGVCSAVQCSEGGEQGCIARGMRDIQALRSLLIT